jgi:hypothetical protein
MTESQRIADLLTEGPDLSAAGLLVAIHDAYIPEPDDVLAVFTLMRHRLLSYGRPTPLGARVAMVLRARGIVPAPGTSA